jgi:hypothetical protein
MISKFLFNFVSNLNAQPFFSGNNLSLQQRLKDFAYMYNPLKRDTVSSTEPYHDLGGLSHQRAKQMGPPVDGFCLPKASYSSALASGSFSTANSLPSSAHQQHQLISGEHPSTAKPKSNSTSILKVGFY